LMGSSGSDDLQISTQIPFVFGQSRFSLCTYIHTYKVSFVKINESLVGNI